jgi:hypothetical protein
MGAQIRRVAVDSTVETLGSTAHNTDGAQL